MKNYTVTGNGTKIHLRHVKEVYLENGKAKVRLGKRESSYAPFKTSCGRYDDSGRALNLVRFYKALNEGKEVCQKCLARMHSVMKEAKALEQRYNK